MFFSELVQFFGQHGVAVGVYYRFAAADNLYLFAYFVGVRFEGIIVFGGNGSYDGSLMRVAEDVAEYTSLAGGVDARFGDNVVGAVSGAGHVENRQRQTNAGIPASRTAPYGAVRKECPVKEFFHRCLADAAGNVFYQGRSEGGMVSWDGCDPAGRRVKSGVYFVFASQGNEGSSKGAVAKILVIN